MKLPDLPRTREQCTQFALTYSDHDEPWINLVYNRARSRTTDRGTYLGIALTYQYTAIKRELNRWLTHVEHNFPELLYTDNNDLERALYIAVAGVCIYDSRP